MIAESRVYYNLFVEFSSIHKLSHAVSFVTLYSSVKGEMAVNRAQHYAHNLSILGGIACFDDTLIRVTTHDAITYIE